MFGKKRRSEETSMREALLGVKTELAAVRAELALLRNDLFPEAPVGEGGKVMSRAEIVNKWSMGENGDGF